MNTRELAKHYGKLTPEERVPLLIDANARGDASEFARLRDAAPKQLFAVSDHAGLIDKLHRLADLHMMLQLNLTAWYRQVGARHAERFCLQDKGDYDPAGNRLAFQERLAAYCFLVNALAWQQFCEELAIGPDVLLRDCPGYDTIQQMERDARRIACTKEEAAAYVRKRDSDAEIRTVEEIVRAMRMFIQTRGGPEGGGT